MRCDVLTLFPGMISGVASHSILKRAQEKDCLDLRIHNIRDYTTDPHHVTDDVPYGGGGGMVMKAEPIFRAVDFLQKEMGELRLIPPLPTREAIYPAAGGRIEPRIPNGCVYLRTL